MNHTAAKVSSMETSMVHQLNVLKLAKTGSLEETHDLEREDSIPVTRSWGALFLATIEAVCLFAVSAAKAGTLLGSVLGAVAGWTTFLHRDTLRIPALLIAIIGSAINLFLLWRSHRLRNMPAAAWRKKPLAARDLWKISLVFALSILTFIVAGSEIYFHRLFHHSFM